jgi:hypothetical protein
MKERFGWLLIITSSLLIIWFIIKLLLGIPVCIETGISFGLDGGWPTPGFIFILIILFLIFRAGYKMKEYK